MAAGGAHGLSAILDNYGYTFSLIIHVYCVCRHAMEINAEVANIQMSLYVKFGYCHLHWMCVICRLYVKFVHEHCQGQI